MKTTEEIKKFAELYFQIEKNAVFIPVWIYYLTDDDYWPELETENIAMLDKEEYIHFLEETLEENGIEDKTLIDLFNKIEISAFKDLLVYDTDIVNLCDSSPEYCGWIIKKEDLNEIVYVKHDYM